VDEKQFKLNAVSCSGLNACKVELLKFAKGIGGVNFLEGMACEGGCVQGPGILIRSPKNQTDVQKHAQQAGDRTILEAADGEKPTEKKSVKKKEPAVAGKGKK
jgi:iron only hydrogenase large subunit-like protein